MSSEVETPREVTCRLHCGIPRRSLSWAKSKGSEWHRCDGFWKIPNSRATTIFVTRPMPKELQ